MLAQLAQAEAERREMLAGLTHDLRAPLARLRVRLALLENDAERDGLERDADDMERIVDQCLGFLHSEAPRAGKVEVLLLVDVVSDEVVNGLEVERGDKADYYYAKPLYRLAIDCNTLNNGKFVAKVDKVYVEW